MTNYYIEYDIPNRYYSYTTVCLKKNSLIFFPVIIYQFTRNFFKIKSKISKENVFNIYYRNWFIIDKKYETFVK